MSLTPRLAMLAAATMASTAAIGQSKHNIGYEHDRPRMNRAEWKKAKAIRKLALRNRKRNRRH